MSNPNNSTELGGMKELPVNESEKDFSVYFKVGCLVIDGQKVKGINVDEEGIKKSDSNSKMKLIGRAKFAEIEKVRKAKKKAKQLREQQKDEAR